MGKSKSRKGRLKSRSKSRSKSGSARKTGSKTAETTSDNNNSSSSSRRTRSSSRSRSAQRASGDSEHEDTSERSNSTPSTAAARRKVVTGPVAPPQTKNNRQQQQRQKQECQATPTGSSDDAEDAVQTTSQQKQTDPVTTFRIYTQQRIVEGNRLVELVFPSRVVHINRILASRHFTPDQFARIGDVIAASRVQLAASQSSASMSARDGGEPATKRRRLETRASGRSARGAARTDVADSEEPGEEASAAERPTISDHTDIVTVEALLKPVLYDLLEGASAVSQWLELSLPTTDDADSVRESVLKAASLNAQIASKLAALRLRELNNYHLTRGHRVAQMMSCSDETVAAEFERLIAENDFRQLLRARDFFVESRDQYLILCNLIEKNREQINTPKSTAFSSLVS